MLAVSTLSVHYGPIAALREVSLEIRRGEMVLLAGANGAGKTTLLRAISGILPAASGEIRFEGERLAGLPADAIAVRGIAHVPEGRRVWPQLTVQEHLQIAGHRLDPNRRRGLQDRIGSLFPRLTERWRQRAGSLSGGEQQMLAIGRGLAADPALLMIDELSLGLAPVVTRQLFGALEAINRDGVTLLIVEQALSQALQVAHRGYVLETGRLVLAGTCGELKENEAVRKAYLSI